MTAIRDTENSNARAVVPGRPFLPGQSGNPKGRPKKGHAIRDILVNKDLKDKRQLVEVAYREALKGNVAWAEWIVKHSGEGAQTRDGDTINIDKAVILTRYIEAEHVERP